MGRNSAKATKKFVDQLFLQEQWKFERKLVAKLYHKVSSQLCLFSQMLWLFIILVKDFILRIPFRYIYKLNSVDILKNTSEFCRFATLEPVTNGAERIEKNFLLKVAETFFLPKSQKR